MREPCEHYYINQAGRCVGCGVGLSGDAKTISELLNENAKLRAALGQERRDHRAHLAAIPPGVNFIPQWKMDEEWPTLASVKGADGCPQVGTGGLHSNDFYDDGSCAYCGVKGTGGA